MYVRVRDSSLGQSTDPVHTGPVLVRVWSIHWASLWSDPLGPTAGLVHSLDQSTGPVYGPIHWARPLVWSIHWASLLVRSTGPDRSGPFTGPVHWTSPPIVDSCGCYMNRPTYLCWKLISRILHLIFCITCSEWYVFIN